MQVTLTREFTFDAAQSVTCFPEGHKCRRLHGHGFKIRISVTGRTDPATGLFYDHAEIARQMKPLIDLVDHNYLNDIEGLENPTLENMLAWFWRKLQPVLPGLSEIVIYETDRAWGSYRGE